MKTEELLTISSDYREDNQIRAFTFGRGQKAACIVGAMRGNEYQQLYICSQLIRILTKLEDKGAIVSGKEIMVIPSLNGHSINIGKKFWGMDNSDINRQFPGNADGVATSRIAARVLDVASEYRYGIQFPSFYLEGEFIPHIRMMDTERASCSLANQFGMPYVLISRARSFDSSTLNYNLQMRGTDAFSVYTGTTKNINESMAGQAVSAVLRFLTRMGIIRYQMHPGYIATVIEEPELISVKCTASGLLHRLCKVNEEVERGEVLAEILHPYDGSVMTQILSPFDGIVFFANTEPVAYENTAILKLIKKLHA
jgi:predicted deacylase